MLSGSDEDDVSKSYLFLTLKKSKSSSSDSYDPERLARVEGGATLANCPLADGVDT